MIITESRRGLLKPVKKIAYASALSLCGAENASVEVGPTMLRFEQVSVQPETLAVGSVVSLNLARVLIKLGAYTEAQALYRCAPNQHMLANM